MTNATSHATDAAANATSSGADSVTQVGMAQTVSVPTAKNTAEENVYHHVARTPRPTAGSAAARGDEALTPTRLRA
ncbi:hypothetical protein GCM10009862_10630 [Microbacterium binotii]|uniref:Uncharacterized protein n=1 Tax=Microbacterium binotii TaxID=462710 RepID=A0ABN3P8A3_9MICO